MILIYFTWINIHRLDIYEECVEGKWHCIRLQLDQTSMTMINYTMYTRSIVQTHSDLMSEEETINSNPSRPLLIEFT